mmetsp:Transcript_20333/g.41026  ORF Transcript_20333/g.41026 Transcript_20333/m.41026 type:complete len:291 (+) Transcript_20333:1519-2391(+)
MPRAVAASVPPDAGTRARQPARFLPNLALQVDPRLAVVEGVDDAFALGRRPGSPWRHRRGGDPRVLADRHRERFAEHRLGDPTGRPRRGGGSRDALVGDARRRLPPLDVASPYRRLGVGVVARRESREVPDGFRRVGRVGRESRMVKLLPLSLDSPFRSVVELHRMLLRIHANCIMTKPRFHRLPEVVCAHRVRHSRHAHLVTERNNSSALEPIDELVGKRIHTQGGGRGRGWRTSYAHLKPLLCGARGAFGDQVDDQVRSRDFQGWNRWAGGHAGPSSTEVFFFFFSGG